ncbi:MAG: gluconolactonase [Acidobacteria bacterium]|nr:gluconolactonase [Acidobacteriota bacterium]|tara:strand:- start:2203 stop:3288 length:1086 start_codon:yes stop_codon:yes gene_type:complete
MNIEEERRHSLGSSVCRIVIGLHLLVLSTVGCNEGTGSMTEPIAEPEPLLKQGAGAIVRIDPEFDALVPIDAQIEKLAEGYMFTEGPVWIRRGTPEPYLLFSDIPANSIKKWSPVDGASDFLTNIFEGDPGDRSQVGSNGLLIDGEGRLILCEHGNRQISRIESDGSVTVLADRYEGKRLNSPNDAVFHSSGSLYFTDPPYGLSEQDDDPDKELNFNGIFRLKVNGEVELLSDSQTRPNGIGFSPDEQTLYVANSDRTNKVWYAYDVLDDGTLGPARVFFDVNDQSAAGAADGMAIDREGTLFATGPGGVWVISPDGRHLGSIQPTEVPANVGWGDDGNVLYMTARTGLYRIRLTTGGAIP